MYFFNLIATIVSAVRTFSTKAGEKLRAFWNNTEGRVQRAIRFWIRTRNVYAVYGSIAVIVLWVLSDPNKAMLASLDLSPNTTNMILYALRSVLFSSILLVTGKAMMDYEEAKFDKLGQKALETSQGAALFAIAVSIKYIAFAIVIAAGVFGA